MHLSHYFTSSIRVLNKVNKQVHGNKDKLYRLSIHKVPPPPNNLNFLTNKKLSVCLYDLRRLCFSKRESFKVFPKKYWWGNLKVLNTTIIRVDKLKNMIHWRSPSHPYPKRRPGKVNKSSIFDRLTLRTDLAYTLVNCTFVYFIILFYPAA